MCLGVAFAVMYVFDISLLGWSEADRVLCVCVFAEKNMTIGLCWRPDDFGGVAVYVNHTSGIYTCVCHVKGERKELEVNLNVPYQVNS